MLAHRLNGHQLRPVVGFDVELETTDGSKTSIGSLQIDEIGTSGDLVYFRTGTDYAWWDTKAQRWKSEGENVT